MNKVIGVEIRQLQGLDYSQFIFFREDRSMREYKLDGTGWGYSAGRLNRVVNGLISELDIHSNGVGVTYYIK